jgi:hypothetical protein
MLEEAKLAREEETRPYVTVRVVLGHDGLNYIVAKNHGRSAARDITFVVEPPFELGPSTSDLPGLADAMEARKLPNLAPGEQISYLWMSCVDYPTENRPHHNVRVRYAGGDRKGRWPVESFDIDLDRLSGVMRDTQDPLQGINDRLEDLTRAVRALR